MIKILFICTHNRCRSILSEAITNQLGKGLLDARSAGSQPAGEVHLLSLKYLQETGYDTAGLKSQSWDDLETFDPDVVITVCDSAAKETCPVWFGKAIQFHWGLADPSKLSGSDDEIRDGFLSVINTIEKRVELLKGLAAKDLTTQELIQQLTQLRDTTS